MDKELKELITLDKTGEQSVPPKPLKPKAILVARPCFFSNHPLIIMVMGTMEKRLVDIPRMAPKI